MSKTILDLKSQFLSGFYPERVKPERYPLKLIEEKGLLQLADRVDQDMLYRDYWYESGINTSMRNHLWDIVKWGKSILRGGDIVLDIGCNDGTLLSYYNVNQLRIGFDPSNIIPNRVSLDIFMQHYFSAKLYNHVANYKATLITSIAMFYDLADPETFVREVASVLADNGQWIIEMHHAPQMLLNNGYDAICHEHLYYYSLATLEPLLKEANLEVIDARVNSVNGGSFAVKVAHRGAYPKHPAVQDLRDWEIDNQTSAQSFASNTRRVTHELVVTVKRFVEEGKVIYGYGASTKGNTILQYSGLGPEWITAIVDRNPRKVGKFMPNGIPIISEKQGRADNPDYMLAFPYHFREEFIERESEYLSRGGGFIFPLPEVEVYRVTED